MQASFVGWLGRRNLGDEAIYLANKKLFAEYSLIEEEYTSDTDVSIFGGGTILPQSLYSSGYDSNKNDRNYAIGVGVRQEVFDNRKKSSLDLRYLFGKEGYNISRVINESPTPIQYGIDFISDRVFGGRITLSDHYFTTSEYELIKKFEFRKLSVRGPESKDQLKKFGIESEITGDTALILEPEKEPNQSNNKVAVCIRGRSKTHSWEKDTDYVNNLLSFCKKMSEEYEFIFLPFYPGDIPVNYRASKTVPNSSFKDYTTYADVQGLMNEIAGCSLMIGEKLHANVLAASCSTPFISIEYSPKHSDFTKSIGMESYNIRNDNISEDLLKQKFERITSDSSIVNKLNSEVSSKRNKLQSFAEEIQNDIHNNS